MPTFALVDCNNFYASCERLFDPTLVGRPLVVLSNNDGCAIARSEEVKAAAQQLYEQLQALGVDVLLDDRGERPGAMFADWELIGVPHRITIGDKGLKEGVVEYQHRRDSAATKVPAAEALALVRSRLTV